MIVLLLTCCKSIEHAVTYMRKCIEHAVTYAEVYRACCDIYAEVYRACCDIYAEVYRACCDIYAEVYRACCDIYAEVYRACCVSHHASGGGVCEAAIQVRGGHSALLALCLMHHMSRGWSLHVKLLWGE